jgi:predicted O-methyltransferase YrrM
MRAVLLDRDDQALELARSDIQAAGLQDRIQLQRADFLVEEIGSGYDLVLLSSVLSVCSQEQNRQLLEKVHRSLNPGGQLLVQDHLLDDAKASPADASIFSVCMLVATAGGQVYSRAELKSWLRELGFEAVHQVPVEHMCLIVGRKPND